MPETQFLFFTKWQEQKRRKFNIDPYMLIQETGIQKIRKQEFKSKKWVAAKQLILQQPILLISYFLFFRLVSREIPIAAKLAAPSSIHCPV